MPASTSASPPDSPPPQPPPKPAAPAIAFRIVAWLFIYLAAFVPILYRPDFRFHPEFVLMFPIFLGMLTAPICNLFQFVTPLGSIVAVFGLYVFPYGMYATNFYGLVHARTRERSSFLLLILALMVLLTQFVLGIAHRSISV